MITYPDDYDDNDTGYDEEELLEFEESDIQELGHDSLSWGDELSDNEEDGWFYDDDDKDDRDTLYDVDEDYESDY